MKSFIRELRRRKVFRSLGLYVGISWLVVQGAAIVLPAFDASAFALRTLVIVAIAGFPLVAALVWIFGSTRHGLEHTAVAEHSPVPAFGTRKLDFVVIGVLVVALAFSLYLNLTAGPAVPAAIEPVSVLIADFSNETSEPVFDGVLEQLLTMSLEAAPYVSLLDRNQAEGLAREVDPDADGLPPPAARLVAVREGVSVLLAGSIEPASGGYRVSMAGLNPLTGETDFDLAADASDRDAVPGAVVSLSRRVREALGDAPTEQDDTSSYRGEPLRATSIEAAKAYADATQLNYQGDPAAAAELYRRATELQPDWGTVYGAWAMNEYQRGRPDAAEALWEKAMSLAGTMPESDRLFRLGSYFFMVREDNENALASFAEYVEKYPGNTAARNNLAVVAFNTLVFTRAADEGRKLVELFPKSRLYRTNLALFAMYAGDFDGAAGEARIVLEEDPGYEAAYLPLAIASLEAGDPDAAVEFYRRMEASPRGFFGERVATIGLADTHMYRGSFGLARDILMERIERSGEESTAESAILQIVLAEAYAASGEDSMAIEAARAALALSRQRAITVSAALVFLSAGEPESARALADELGGSLPAFNRAYAGMIEAAFQRESGQPLDAIATLRTAIRIADLWRIHWELGRAHLDAGEFAAALAEFELCAERRGEAVATFLDDVPTYRYLAELPYWTARARAGLGMRDDAAAGYEAFLALRPEGGQFVNDARRRLASLSAEQ